MTIIVAIRVPGQGAVLACDSRATAGDEIISDNYLKCGAGAEVVYATAGVARDMISQIEADTWPEVRDQALNLEYEGWTLLAADRHGVHFLHNGGFSVSHPSYSAIGSGGSYALGYMDAHKKPKTIMDAIKIAKGAVKCAMSRDSGCGGKIRVVTL